MVVTVPDEQEALLGHPMLDALGWFLDRQAPSVLIWATSAADQVDETGTRLADAARALAQAYGTDLTVTGLDTGQGDQEPSGDRESAGGEPEPWQSVGAGNTPPEPAQEAPTDGEED